MLLEIDTVLWEECLETTVLPEPNLSTIMKIKSGEFKEAMFDLGKVRLQAWVSWLSLSFTNSLIFQVFLPKKLMQTLGVFESMSYFLAHLFLA
jgi:hypothetical protein